MKAKRKAVSIMVTLSMLLMLLVPVSTAFASASDNTALTVPYVQAGEDDQTMGALKIREDDSQFREGDIVTVDLPSGVEYSVDATAGTLSAYVFSTDCSFDLVTASSKSVTVEIYGTELGNNEVIYFFYGENVGGIPVASTVDIDSDVTGDISVEIDAAGTTITSEAVRVARITEGDTITTIADVEAIALDSTDEIETIKIKETVPGVIDPDGDDIVFELPNDFEWVLGTETVSATGGLTVTSITVEIDDPEKLLINVGGTETSGQAGFIAISGLQIMVPDDADEGDVEMNVDGNEVTEEDIVVATVGDFGFKVDVDGSVPTLVAGKTDKEVADFYIDDIVPGTWIDGRSVKMTLPSWAEWNDIDGDVGELENGKIDADDPEILKYTATGDDGKAEFEEFTVNIDADAPEGDLVVKFSGSAGVEGELVIAKVIKPFTVTAEAPEVFIGLQDQAVGDITITETEEEAIDEDKWIILKAPAGFSFKDSYDIEATELEIDNDDVDGRYLAFQVTNSSNGDAGVIKITNLNFNVDRTIPVGDITFEVFMTTNDALSDDEDINDGFNGDFDDAIDQDFYEDVTDVVVGFVMNPAPGGKVTNSVFCIGATTYTVDGVEMTADVAPYISGDRAFLSIRFLANALGVADNNITWNPIDNSVLIIKGERVVKMTVGSTVMMVNGVSINMDVAPQNVLPGRVMLPFRYACEALGASCVWDAATQCVTVNFK